MAVGAGTAPTVAHANDSRTELICPSGIMLGTSNQTCKIEVYQTSGIEDVSPAGTVTLSSAAYIDPVSCTLHDEYWEALVHRGGCTVTVTPRTAGEFTVRANYQGGSAFYDPIGPAPGWWVTHGRSDATKIINGNVRPVDKSVACTTPQYKYGTTTCTVTVADAEGSLPPAGMGGDTDMTPRGTVRMTAVNAGQPGGGPQEATCTLQPGANRTSSCSATFEIRHGWFTIGGEYTDPSGKHKPGNIDGRTFETVARPTTTEITCDTTSAEVIGALPCTARVTAGGGGIALPSGSVNLSRGLASSPGGTGELSTTRCELVHANGIASCNFTYTPTAAPTTGRQDQLVGSFESINSQEYSSSSGSLLLSVLPRRAGVVVDCTPNSTVAGSAVNCDTLLVDSTISGFRAPSGTITWRTSGTGTFPDGNTCTVTLYHGASACPKRYIPSAGSAGTRTDVLQVRFVSTDGYHATVDSWDGWDQAKVVVTARDSSTTVSCSGVTLGKPSSCTATVTDPSGTSAPTGDVVMSGDANGSFNPNRCTLAPATSTSSTCTLSSYVPTAPGTTKVSAAYQGGSHLASNSPQTDVSVGKRLTALSMSCPSAPSGVGAECTITVTDATTGTKSNPTGTVSLSANIGSWTPTTCTLTPDSGKTDSSSCKPRFTRANPGVSSVTATYQASSSHSGSTEQINAFATNRTSEATISCPSGAVGEPVTCVVTVVDVTGGTASTPSGNVTLSATGGSFDTSGCVVSGSGATTSCQVTFRGSAVGTAQVSAYYLGTGDHNGDSTPTTNVTVTKRASSTAIACPSTPVGVATLCTITVRDTTAGAKRNPAGSVALTSGAGGSFASNTCTLAAKAGADDTSTCTRDYTPTVVGSHTVIASYAGGSEHDPSSGSADAQGQDRPCLGTSMSSYFSSRGYEECFVVPEGITSVSVTAVGGVGGPGLYMPSGGGWPGVAKGKLPVTPGQKLFVNVAGNGSGTTGGWNGGGDGGVGAYGGGGASDIRSCSRTTCAPSSGDTRLVVAGGGGGGGGAGTTGTIKPGGASGLFGSGGGDGYDGYGGGAGRQDGPGGGGGGAEYGWEVAGDTGLRGQGGNGGSLIAAGNTHGGGGGGGGLFGGGGGGTGAHIYTVSQGGGGGGGSSSGPNGFTLGPDYQNSIPSVQISYQYAPANVALTFTNSGTVTADGTTWIQVVAKVTDSAGRGLTGHSVSFSSSDSGQFVSTTVADEGGGNYRGYVRASTTAGTPMITATVNGTDPVIRGSATMTQTHGAPASVAIALDRGVMTADGTSTATATATLRDAHGNAIKGQPVAIELVTGAVKSLSPAVDQGDGTYRSVVTAPTVSGGAGIRARLGSMTSDPVNLAFLPGPAANIDLSLDPAEIVANGSSTTVARAVVTDVNGNRTAADLTVESPAHPSRSMAYNNATEVYEATLTSTITAGTIPVTARMGATAVTKNLVQTPGTPDSVALTLDPGSIVADGSSTTTARATVKDAAGNPVPSATVSFTSNGAQQIGAPVHEGGGVFRATIKSSKVAGAVRITATAGTKSDEKTLTQTAGPATQIALALDPASIVADGASQTTATATLVDANDNKVPGRTVTISSAGSQAVTSTSDQGDGTHTATITSTEVAGTAQITAVSDSLSASATLTQVPGEPASMSTSIDPASIAADGASKATVTAVLRDAHGNRVPGKSVLFSTNGTQEWTNAATDDGGTYTREIRASTTAGEFHVAAIYSQQGKPPIVGTARLTQTPGPATAVSVALDPSSIVADGSSTTTARAVATDAFGNRVPGQTIDWSADGGQAISDRTDKGDGVYEATVKSTTSAGTSKVKAAIGAAVSGEASLTQVAGGPAAISVSLDPASIVADGASKTKATAVVVDANDNRVAGRTVTFESSGAQGVGDTSDNGNGVYEAEITSTTESGSADIVARVGGLDDSATLTQRAGAPASVKVTLDPASIVADGESRTTASALVEDAFGNDIEGAEVGWTADGGQAFITTQEAGGGVYDAVFESTTTSGKSKIKATVSGVTGEAELTQAPGAPHSISVSLDPASIVANGASETTATAVVKDVNENVVPGLDVAFESDGEQNVSDTTDKGAGKYEATVTSTAVTGNATIKASVGDLDDSAELTQVAGAPAAIELTLDPASVVADGASQTVTTAIVRDAHDNRVPGADIDFASNTDNVVGATDEVDDAVGEYQSTITSTTVARDVTITAKASDTVTGRATLVQEPGAVTKIDVTLDPATLVADGSSTSVVTAHATDANDNDVPGASLEFSADGGQDIADFEDEGAGIYSATVESTTTSGDYKIAAKVGDVTGDATLKQLPGAADSISLTLDPASIVANGSASTVATARVADVNDNGVPDQSVEIESDGGQTVKTLEYKGDGKYVVEIVSTTTAGSAKVTAESGTLTDEATLTQVAGPATSIELKLDPDSIVADGSATTQATVTLKDANDNAVSGDPVELSTDGGQSIGDVTDHEDGTYTAEVKSTKVSGDSTITAKDGDVLKDEAVLEQVAGVATDVDLTLDPASIVADGSTTTVATAKVSDANGNVVADDDVVFSSSDGDQGVGDTTKNRDGSYSATVTSTKKAGKLTITAKDASVDADVSGDADLTQTHGPAAELSLSLDPDTITADGEDTTSAVATVTDANGNRVPGEAVSFTSDDAGHAVGSTSDKGDGTYEATIRSTTKTGSAKVTATDGSLADDATLSQVAGPVTGVKLTLERDSLTADGADATKATAVATDAKGNRVPGATIAFVDGDRKAIGGDVKDEGDGVYTATITAARKAGKFRVGAGEGRVWDWADIALKPGKAASVKISLASTSVVAGSSDRVPVAATVLDANGNAVSGEPVRFGSTDGGHAFGDVVDNGDGTYSSSLLPSGAAGAATISAAVGSISDSATFTQTARPVVTTPGGQGEPGGSSGAGGSGGSGGSAKLKPRFVVNAKPTTVRMAADGTVTVPGAWLVCPSTAADCQLNTVIRSFGKIALPGTKAKDRVKRRRVLGSSLIRVQASDRARLEIKLSAGARRLLARDGQVKVVVAAGAHANDGELVKMTKTFVVKKAKAKKAATPK